MKIPSKQTKAPIKISSKSISDVTIKESHPMNSEMFLQLKIIPKLLPTNPALILLDRFQSLPGREPHELLKFLNGRLIEAVVFL